MGGLKKEKLGPMTRPSPGSKKKFQNASTGQEVKCEILWDLLRGTSLLRR